MKTSSNPTCGCYLIAMLICAAIGAFLWPYAIETIGQMLGKEVAVAWWQGALLGFCPVIGQTTVPFAVAAWILGLFLLV